VLHLYRSRSAAAVNRCSALRLAADASRGACPSRGVFAGVSRGHDVLGESRHLTPSAIVITGDRDKLWPHRWWLHRAGQSRDKQRSRARKRAARRRASCMQPSGEEHWTFQILRIRGQPVAVAVLFEHCRDQGGAERLDPREGVSSGKRQRTRSTYLGGGAISGESRDAAHHPWCAGE